MVSQRPPRTSEELHSELARLKAERLARRAKDRPLEGPGPDTQGAGSGVQVELARPGRPNWDGTQ